MTDSIRRLHVYIALDILDVYSDNVFCVFPWKNCLFWMLRMHCLNIVGYLFFQVQEDLETLKERLISQSDGDIDISALESAIKKTEHGIKVSHNKWSHKYQCLICTYNILLIILFRCTNFRKYVTNWWSANSRGEI